MFPTDTIEMSLLWMYLIYFNMGLLNDDIKERDITGCSIQYFRSDVCDQVLVTNIRILFLITRAGLGGCCTGRTASLMPKHSCVQGSISSD